MTDIAAERLSGEIELSPSGVTALSKAVGLLKVIGAEMWPVVGDLARNRTEVAVRKAAAALPGAILGLDLEFGRVLDVEPLDAQNGDFLQRITELRKAVADLTEELGSSASGAAVEMTSCLAAPANVLDAFLAAAQPVATEETAAAERVRKTLDRKIKVLKAKKEDEEERYVLGIVLEPNDGEGDAPLDPDSQDHIYSAEEIRKSAHEFMEDFRNIGLMHEELANDRIKILECYIAPAAFEVAGQPVRKGSWLLGLRIVDDDVWEDVKLGEYAGLSIGGDAYSRPVAS